MTSVATTSKQISTEWEIMHLDIFCLDDVQSCPHELMLEGLAPVFDVLDQKCKPMNNWRNRETYGVNKARYKCTFCLSEIASSDHPMGVFKRGGGKRTRSKVFVIHDTCLATISLDKDTVLPSVEQLLSDRDAKKSIEEYCIFEGKGTCTNCKKSVYKQSTEKKKKLASCSDKFCMSIFHWDCAMKQWSCTIDFSKKILYCKYHEGVFTRANHSSLRKEPISHSPAEGEICIECSQRVSRWPLFERVFYVSCCDSYLHYQCVLRRFKRMEMRCGNCKSLNRYISSIQRQGYCLLQYSEEMKKIGIRFEDIHECNSEVEKDEDEEEEEEKREEKEEPAVIVLGDSDDEIEESSCGNKENVVRRVIKKGRYADEGQEN